jgi:RNA polymerase sigma-32 factor
MALAATGPSLTSEAGLSSYLRHVHRYPLLEAGEEYMLAKRWREHADSTAAHKLVTSHLRLVAKIAMGYRRYGLPIADLVAEGNVGLMLSLRRFDPDRGFRLATYAVWWIRAAIQEYVLHSWSLVKIGTTGAQKKLFFNLRRLKGRLRAFDEGNLSPAHVARIATELGVLEAEVVDMNQRLAGPDFSLNAPPDREADGQWQDQLADDSPDQERVLGQAQELEWRSGLLRSALAHLADRERDILVARRLRDEPTTLDNLSRKYGISQERVRQIEIHAIEKLRRAIWTAASGGAARDGALSNAASPRRV